jgi:hypothetical protein
LDVLSYDSVNTAVAIGSLGATVVSISFARRPSVAALPPELPVEVRSEYVKSHAESSKSAELSAEIVERIFLAEDTPDTPADDIAAREAGIVLLEGRLAEADTPEERMPIRRRLRELRSETARLEEGSAKERSSWTHRLSAFFDPAWSVMYKLPPLRGRKRPWLAAVIGFAFGGIGLSLYFRKLIDIAVLIIVIVVALVSGTVLHGGWWLGAAIASFYGYLRAESSNRRLALKDTSGGDLSLGTGGVQSAG